MSLRAGNVECRSTRGIMLYTSAREQSFVRHNEQCCVISRTTPFSITKINLGRRATTVSSRHGKELLLHKSIVDAWIYL